MIEEIEIWKDIEGFEGYYKISTFGRIKSLVRPRRTTEKILKSYPSSGYRYLTLYLSKDGINKKIKVHQLVAITFLGHKPNNLGFVVNHKDFNIWNNRLSNLEIVTQRENSNRQHIPHTSKYTGVYLHKNKWRATITDKKRQLHLGTFEQEIDAHYAYESARELIDSSRERL